MATKKTKTPAKKKRANKKNLAEKTTCLVNEYIDKNPDYFKGLKPVDATSTNVKLTDIQRNAVNNKKRWKSLQDISDIIGGELVEFYDEFGKLHVMTRDSAIIYKFMQICYDYPTAQNVLALQKLKHQDVQKISFAQDTDNKPTEELQQDLTLLLKALNYNNPDELEAMPELTDCDIIPAPEAGQEIDAEIVPADDTPTT